MARTRSIELAKPQYDAIATILREAASAGFGSMVSKRHWKLIGWPMLIDPPIAPITIDHANGLLDNR